MKHAAALAFLLSAASAASAQDQQLGARTKAMGGSYTAFEDDPVSVWLNPAGIATQSTSASIAYQTYTTYPLHRDKSGNSVGFSAGAETTFVDPAFIPSYLGFVFHLGPSDSGMALGLCYASPYHLNYSFDRVDDPFQQTFTPDSNVDQSFGRFRAALAKDFRIKEPGEAGFLTHVSGAVAVDAGYERWEFKSTTESASDNSTAFGFGLGLLVGVYDNAEDFKVNLGLGYQSAVKWNFNIDTEIFPAFDMPQQVNVGLTFYILKNAPLRATVDFQWIDWSETADNPTFPGKPRFDDAYNYSLGLEYRIPILEHVALYPRLGYRRFDAPWSDKNDLPMTSNYKLVLDTKGAAFNIVTLGLGISWTSDDGKVRSVDIAGDFGGDAANFALGYNHEF